MRGFDLGQIIWVINSHHHYQQLLGSFPRCKTPPVPHWALVMEKPKDKRKLITDTQNLTIYSESHYLPTQMKLLKNHEKPNQEQNHVCLNHVKFSIFETCQCGNSCAATSQ